MKFSMASLFSGAGGADLGFEQEGFITLFANDINHDCLETYERNFDIRPYGAALQTLPWKKLIIPGTVDVVIGGPPCQSFSSARTTVPKDLFSCDGLRNVYEMQAFVEYVKPKIFVCENVATLFRPSMQHIYEVFLRGWKGYNVHAFELSTEDYGIPQKRRRAFFVGIRKPNVYSFTKPDGKHWRSLYTGWAEYLGYDSSYVMLKRANAIKEVNYDEPAYTVVRAEQIVVRKRGHKTGMITSERMAHGIVQKYLDVKEVAKLQGFPDSFEFYGNKLSVLSQIGNAWSVSVARAIAKECKRCLISMLS